MCQLVSGVSGDPQTRAAEATTEPEDVIR